MARTALMPSGAMRAARLIALLVLAISASPAFAAETFAAGAPGSDTSPSRGAPEWMSAELAAQLDLPFNVLVPTSVPAPFGGEPAVEAAEGSYSLYWMIPGGPPTFLLIAGEVGGEIPDYSKYDRNNQLEQNADVGGTPAYHDLTPIYDLVYWEVDGVVYSVESQNLTEEDSLSVANALIPLGATGESGEAGVPDSGVWLSLPDWVTAGETVAIEVYGGQGADLSVDGGIFTETGEALFSGGAGQSVNWQAPSPEEDTWVTFSVTDPDSGEALAYGSTLVLAAQADAGALSLECPETLYAGERMEFVLRGSGDAIVDAGDGFFPAEPPNTDFAPGADGGRTLVGMVPESGGILLVWSAPEVVESTTVYLFATNPQGETTGECALSVLPLSETDSGGSSGDPEVGEAQAAESEPEETNEAEPTKKPREKRDGDDDEAAPTALVNEVSGIPTSGPGTDAGGTGTSPPPSPTPNLTPTVRPTATIAPTFSDDGMAATIVGPDGGTLSSSLGATVIISAGSLVEPATLSIVPVADTQLPIQDGVQLISASGFDISLAGPNGLALEEKLEPPAELRIELDEDVMREGVRIYRVQGSALEAMTNTRIEGTTLAVSVDRFSRFVAGVPTSVDGGRQRSLLPFLLAAFVVVLVMVATTVLGGLLRPRRQRVVVSRRPPPRRPRYR